MIIEHLLFNVGNAGVATDTAAAVADIGGQKTKDTPLTAAAAALLALALGAMRNTV